jgi:DNA replication protein DnaC
MMRSDQPVITATPKTCAHHGPFVERTIQILHRSIVTQGCKPCREERAHDQSMKAATNAEVARQAAVKGAIVRACVPSKYIDARLGNFEVSIAAQRAVLDRCKWFLDTWRERKSLGTSMLLVGKPGTGKTHLGCAIAISVARLGDTALFATATEFTRAIRETYNGGKLSEAQTIERYAAPSLLVLDEVGASSGSDHEKQQLFELINRRYSESRPTLLLTNLSVEEVQAYLGERIMDRLRDGGGKLLRLDWESHRK